MDKSAPVPAAVLQPGANVFLVDDDASVRRALARLIKSAGHNVQTFASAREFLENQTQAAKKQAVSSSTFACPVLTGSTSSANYKS